MATITLANGTVFEGTVKEIQEFMGIVNTTSKVSTKVSTPKVNTIPTEEDLKPSKKAEPRKYYKKSKAFDPNTATANDVELVFKKDLQYIKGIGYYVVLDSYTKTDCFQVLKNHVGSYNGTYQNKKGEMPCAFIFKAKADATKFMKDFKVIKGEERRKVWLSDEWQKRFAK